MITIQQYALITAHMADALRDQGYQATIPTMRVLRDKVCRDWGVEDLHRFESWCVEDLLGYLKHLKFTAKMRWELRTYKSN